MTVVHLGRLSLSFFFFSSAVFCWWGNERTEQQTINKQRRQTEQRKQQINQRTNHKSGQQHARVHSVISEGRSGGACHLQHSSPLTRPFFRRGKGGGLCPHFRQLARRSHSTAPHAPQLNSSRSSDTSLLANKSGQQSKARSRRLVSTNENFCPGTIFTGEL